MHRSTVGIRTAVGALALAALVALPGAASADPQRPRPVAAQRSAQQGPVRIEVLVIDAYALPGESSPVLANIPQLHQPPFSAFGSMRLLSRRVIPLTAEAHNTPLPGGRGEMAVSLAGQTAGRYQVTVRFTRNTTSTIQFVAALGEPFFTVRASRPDKALVLGFIVR